jgi:hypothetical protein
MLRLDVVIAVVVVKGRLQTRVDFSPCPPIA